jgi:hypothetical protein
MHRKISVDGNEGTAAEIAAHILNVAKTPRHALIGQTCQKLNSDGPGLHTWQVYVATDGPGGEMTNLPGCSGYGGDGWCLFPVILGGFRSHTRKNLSLAEAMKMRGMLTTELERRFAEVETFTDEQDFTRAVAVTFSCETALTFYRESLVEDECEDDDGGGN